MWRQKGACVPAAHFNLRSQLTPCGLDTGATVAGEWMLVEAGDVRVAKLQLLHRGSRGMACS